MRRREGEDPSITGFHIVNWGGSAYEGTENEFRHAVEPAVGFTDGDAGILFPSDPPDWVVSDSPSWYVRIAEEADEDNALGASYRALVWSDWYKFDGSVTAASDLRSRDLSVVELIAAIEHGLLNPTAPEPWP